MKKPDWNNDEDYEYTENLSYEGWAWEFLRRSNKYRDAYEKFLVHAAELEEEFGADWRELPQARAYVPPRRADEDEHSWMARCAIAPGRMSRRVRIDKLYGEEFGLDGMFDTDATVLDEVHFLEPTRYPLLVWMPDDLDDLLEEYDTRDHVTDEPDDGAVVAFNIELGVLVFDLTLSVDKQLKKASALLQQTRDQRGIKNPHLPSVRPSWRRYLRILDANLAKASLTDIAKVLWPNPGPEEDPIEQAKAALKQARKWTTRTSYSRLLIRHMAEQSKENG